MPNKKPNSKPEPISVEDATVGSNEDWKQPHKPIAKKKIKINILAHFQTSLSTCLIKEDLDFGSTQNGLETTLSLCFFFNEL